MTKRLRKMAANLSELATIIELLPSGNGVAFPIRRRRSKTQVAKLRKMLKAARKRGISVADLAKQHGVSTNYIYMLK